MSISHIAETLPPGGSLLVITGPSGAGKTTLSIPLLQHYRGRLAKSISATSRSARPDEKQGRDYDFIGVDAFLEYCDHDMFLEWQEVYGGTYYGTPKDRIMNIWQMGQTPALVIDVVGGINLKRLDRHRVKTIAIMPPSLDVLRKRLEDRKTETPEKLEERVEKARWELEQLEKNWALFDHFITNDDLSTAEETLRILVGRMDFMRKMVALP